MLTRYRLPPRLHWLACSWWMSGASLVTVSVNLLVSAHSLIKMMSYLYITNQAANRLRCEQCASTQLNGREQLMHTLQVKLLVSAAL